MFGATGRLPEIGKRFEEGVVKMARASEGTRSEDRSPPRVVILGGGYGGVYAALNLQKAARRGQIELSLVSRDNFFLSQPMLAEMGLCRSCSSLN